MWCMAVYRLWQNNKKSGVPVRLIRKNAIIAVEAGSVFKDGKRHFEKTFIGFIQYLISTRGDIGLTFEFPAELHKKLTHWCRVNRTVWVFDKDKNCCGGHVLVIYACESFDLPSINFIFCGCHLTYSFILSCIALCCVYRADRGV